MPDKALLIGINDYQSVGALRGCENDVLSMEALLTGTLGFTARNVKRLLGRSAKKNEVTKQMQWLLKDARAGDRLVLHFSGHGSYTASDEDGDEDRGPDELLCLVDMDFRNPGTYITDDELRAWTGKLPQGARLLVVLDCCHSGTGTRLVSRSAVEPPQAIIEQDTAQRVVKDTREAVPAAQVASRVWEVVDPTSEHAVLARFAPPPPEIAARVEVKRRTTRRGRLRDLVAADLNHVLLAACRDDQTAADAYLGNSFNGAFTYHLCRTLEAMGASAGREEIHRRVVQALKAGHFAQVPQFEGQDGHGTLFGEKPTRPPVKESDPGVQSPSPTDPLLGRVTDGQAYALLQQILASGEPLKAEERRMALDILSRLVPAHESAPGLRARAAGRYLVYVHGICEHPPQYSDPWWRALEPYVNGVFGTGTLGQQRQEVLWSDLVNSSRTVAARGDGEREQVRRELVETLQERVDQHALLAAGTQRSAVGTAEVAQRLDLQRGTRGLPGMDCIDDFTIYMTNDDVRAQVLERFTTVVRPLLEEGAEIDLISHSWGTVVAYEGLRELEDAGFTTQQVRTLFTVGSALSIGPVRWRLRQANRDGRKPALVRRWVNLDATGDPVGGALIRHFRVDDEFLGLDPVGCTPNWLGIYNASCAHGSYFQEDNERVNKGIFGLFINA